jgi:hypothetical protein
VQLPDGRTLPMSDLRSGDRVLAVGWDGRRRYEEVYFWNHRNPAGMGNFATLVVAEPGGGATHRLQLSHTHYLAAGEDPSGACAALAQAVASGEEGGLASVQAAWTLAAGRLNWQRDHFMALPPSVHAGMVAWTVGQNASAGAAPACVLSVEDQRELGAYSPFVRVGCRLSWLGWRLPVTVILPRGLATRCWHCVAQAQSCRVGGPQRHPASLQQADGLLSPPQARGIVVDGVVASPHTK